ncbi:hypothetical protein [Yokenella regensburgei]|uniref:hypothetical protein n=1 Tax=Yokenella regensburgei TaxID=158877 RepID=UPI003ED9A3B2
MGAKRYGRVVLRGVFPFRFAGKAVPGVRPVVRVINGGPPPRCKAGFSRALIEANGARRESFGRFPRPFIKLGHSRRRSVRQTVEEPDDGRLNVTEDGPDKEIATTLIHLNTP